MSLHTVVAQTRAFASNNSSSILTAIGVAGVLATTALAVRATAKSIAHMQADGVDPSSIGIKEKVAYSWPFFLSTAAVASTTCVAIVFANRIGLRRATALATALTVSERAMTEYQNKVVERYGEFKEQEIRDSIRQDRVNANPVDQREVIILGGDQLCYDAYSGRYFQSTMESIKHAINRLNYQIVHDNYASLTDFYNFIGLEGTSISDEVGWNVSELFDVQFTTTMSADGRPAIVLDYRVTPFKDYFRVR